MTQATVQPDASQQRYVTREEMESSPTGQHLLLGEFVAPVSAADPTAETRGITDGMMKAWSEHGRLHLAIFSKALDKWSVLQEEHKGTIKLFYGLEADIEEGWRLCDGSNGTPDLRGYFALGASSWTEIGEVTEEQTLVIGTHTPGTITSGAPSAGASLGGTGVIAATGDHTHDTTIPDQSHTVTTPYAPPSVKLAYIMKVI